MTSTCPSFQQPHAAYFEIQGRLTSLTEISAYEALKKSPNGKKGCSIVHTAHEYDPIGNRCHISGAPYTLPDDRQEIGHIDLSHYLLRYVLKGNYLAPIVQPARILDIGCGSGRWLSEMALEFPQADLVGVDFIPPDEEATAFL